MIIAFVIWTIAALLFIGIGVSARKSKEAVGFFTFGKPPAVTDVCSYNRAVSLLWFIAAAVFEILGVPFLFLEQNSPAFVVIILGLPVWVIGIIIVYLKIEAKFICRH